MARPLKQGVDYFPLDVHIDNKLKFIKIKYGIEGYGVMICLLQHIYSLSYWCSCTDDDILLLSDELKIGYDLLFDVIKEGLKRDFFNQELYEKHSILTSKGIQKRYQEIVKRRKEVEVIEEYLVIDNNFGVNVNINEVNADTMQTSSKHDVSKSTQSKVNKTKVKEKKEVYRTFKHLTITVEEFERLIKDGYSKIQIDNTLDDIENYAKNKNYTNLNLTVRKWLKKEVAATNEKGFNRKFKTYGSD